MFQASFYEKDGQLWFRLECPSKADTKAEPFIFEGLATARHVKEYEGLYQKFLKSKNLKDEVTAIMIEASEVVEIPEAEV